jgi:hypothetical protein
LTVATPNRDDRDSASWTGVARERRVPHLRVVETVVDEDTANLPGAPNCRASLEEAETWERRVLELERKLRAALEDKDAKLRNDKDYVAAVALFDEWKRETNHPRARLDTNRAQLALRAIRGYRKDRDKLSWVIQYGRHFAYVDGNGVKHDRFGLLFQDAEHIEKYANAWARRRREVVS